MAYKLYKHKTLSNKWKTVAYGSDQDVSDYNLIYEVQHLGNGKVRYTDNQGKQYYV